MMSELQIELAARKLCELRGLDANQMVAHSAQPGARGFMTMQLLHSPEWRLVAQEVRNRIQLDEAIAFALDALPAG